MNASRRWYGKHTITTLIPRQLISAAKMHQNQFICSGILFITYRGTLFMM